MTSFLKVPARCARSPKHSLRSGWSLAAQRRPLLDSEGRVQLAGLWSPAALGLVARSRLRFRQRVRESPIDFDKRLRGSWCWLGSGRGGSDERCAQGLVRRFEHVEREWCEAGVSAVPCCGVGVFVRVVHDV